MRLTCRPPERTKPKQPDFHHPPMTAIPTPSPFVVSTGHPPLSPSLTSTPQTNLPPPTPQFFSAPPVLSRDPQPYRVSPVAAPRPSHNDILKRIVKADDGIKKKSTPHNAHFKSANKVSKRGNVIPPPPLSKYKRPPPIVPHRPGDRYPLGIPRRCAREDCAQNSKASVARHCISEYVQKGARGSCIPKELRVEWCNTCYMTHRRDADYYPRVFSLLLDQLEICAKEDNATNFVTQYKEEERVVDLIGAHEFILRIWDKWDRDGKIRKFRIIPEKY